MVEQRTGALILAAGLSTRMEGFKPLVKFHGMTLLEHAIGLFRNTGIDEIVTVIGHRSVDLIPFVEATSTRYVINDNYQDGMFSSIQQGTRGLKNTCESFFLLPVDIPFVHPDTILQLLDEFNNDSAVLVCYPQFNSRRGHPPLIDCTLADQILTYDGQDGMRGFLKRYEDQSIIVPVDDPFILMDIDTQKDLSSIKKELNKRV